MNKKSAIILTAIFIIMLAINYMTPLYNEDYFASFVWPMGVPNLGELPENTKRVSSIGDLLGGLKVYYFTGGGRVPGAIIGGVFTYWGKVIFNPFNSLVFILLIAEIYWLSHEGAITADFQPSKLIWIFFALWTFNGPFVGTYLWMSGATDYLWMQVVVLAFLIPYIQNYHDSNLYSLQRKKLTIGMFFLGILAGCSHETTICWLILVLFYWLYLCNKDNKLQNWKIAGFIGLCIGYGILILAPGNFTRLGETQHYMGSNERLAHVLYIMFFHFVLWYFIFKFILVCRKKIISGEAVNHYKLAKAFLVIAVGSSVFNFLLPVSGWRPSFLSLVFLIITLSLLCRAQEKAQLTIISDAPKALMKGIASLYLIFSLLFCLYGDYGSWKYWNQMLAHIETERSLHPNDIVEIIPPDEKLNQSTLWHCLTMFRVIFPPVVSESETDRINKIVARYYGVKGIRVVESKE